MQRRKNDKIQYGNEIQIIDNKTIKYNNFEYILINTSPDKLLYKNDYYDDLFSTINNNNNIKLYIDFKNKELYDLFEHYDLIGCIIQYPNHVIYYDYKNKIIYNDDSVQKYDKHPKLNNNQVSTMFLFKLKINNNIKYNIKNKNISLLINKHNFNKNKLNKIYQYDDKSFIEILAS